MLSERSSPAVVSAAAANKLPRYALLALLICFIAPFLLSPQLLGSKNLTSFGIAWTMVNGSLSDWLIPNVAGETIYDVGPLTSWVSAIIILTVGKILDPIRSFHLTSGFWFAIITACIWYSTYLLARRDEAQPVSFAFGGEAARKDYGRVVADISLLITIGTYGLLEPLHEISPTTTLLAVACICFFGIVLSLEDLKRGSLLAGLGIGLGALTTTIGASIWLAFATWVAYIFTPDYTSRSKRVLITFITALVVTFIWPAIVFLCVPDQASSWFTGWLHSSTTEFSFLSITQYPWLLKNLAWITFPAWPFAIWAVFAWRGSLKCAPISIPLSFLSISLFSILFTGLEPKTTMYCLVPSLAVLTGFGLISVKKSKENFLDLFSGIVFTLGLIVVWIYYYAWSTGHFTKMAYSLRRLAPEVTPGTSYLLLIIAAAATIFWIALVFWRLFKHPVVAWRGTWLSACGLTVSAIVVCSLFLPIFNGARTMEYSVAAIKTSFDSNRKPGDCVEAIGLSLSDRAAFYALADIPFGTPGQKCSFAIKTIQVSGSPVGAVLDNWEVLANVPGRPRSHERYQLLRRLPF